MMKYKIELNFSLDYCCITNRLMALLIRKNKYYLEINNLKSNVSQKIELPGKNNFE